MNHFPGLQIMNSQESINSHRRRQRHCRMARNASNRSGLSLEFTHRMHFTTQIEQSHFADRVGGENLVCFVGERCAHDRVLHEYNLLDGPSLSTWIVDAHLEIVGKLKGDTILLKIQDFLIWIDIQCSISEKPMKNCIGNYKNFIFYVKTFEFSGQLTFGRSINVSFKRDSKIQDFRYESIQKTREYRKSSWS